MDPLQRVKASDKLDEKMKKRIVAKMKNVYSAISDIEKLSELKYPQFYVEPVLTVSVSQDNFGGIGVLYARTIPVDTSGRIEIVVQLSGALVIYATKASLKLVLAHEFLHYIELIKDFSSGNISSQFTSSSIFEEHHLDSRRAIDPLKVFPRRKLAKDLARDLHGGFDDEKLNEKCRKLWIEKGLPTAKISMGENQVRISMESVANSQFDPKIVMFLSGISSK
ncbi:MAG TPA: hypothetical protein VN739_07710 [Nitrososphaerales archaeon]|nr:hypothetical protein [Nitrososphaerales archaeon]